MAHSKDLALRRRVVAVLSVSIRDRTLTPELINGLAEVLQVTPTVIYSDLRALEPEVGCLLLNAQR